MVNSLILLTIAVMDIRDFPTSETSEHEVSSPTPAANPLPPPSQKRKNRSEAWDHFIVVSEEEKRAKCIYCPKEIKFSGGTSSMRNHWLKHKEEDRNKKQKSGSCSTADMEGNSSAISKFDQMELRRALGKVFIGLELPFRKVDHEALHYFLNLGIPQFKIPSRTTLSRDILQMWGNEKVRLKTFLSQHCGRVCLTTDFWTSCQNYSYMSLTAHFVDNNWKLQKKILNFCQVSGHSGDVMAQTVWNCLTAWGLNKVLTMTVDNASSNDVGISQLKKALMPDGLLMGGEYFHTRCCAHVLNLIVKEGLKDIEREVARIRGAVSMISIGGIPIA
jgi:hypothetical protein